MAEPAVICSFSTCQVDGSAPVLKTPLNPYEKPPFLAVVQSSQMTAATAREECNRLAVGDGCYPEVINIVVTEAWLISPHHARLVDRAFICRV